MEIQGLKNQVSVLESQLQSKDDEINNLKASLSVSEQTSQSQVREAGNKGVMETKSHPTMKQIQTALANAGYNPGVIDGKKGRQTKEAIRAFQKAHDIHADGKCGKKTWDLLKEYLDKKSK